jgi:hypothetical protein
MVLLEALPLGFSRLVRSIHIGRVQLRSVSSACQSPECRPQRGRSAELDQRHSLSLRSRRASERSNWIPNPSTVNLCSFVSWNSVCQHFARCRESEFKADCCRVSHELVSTYLAGGVADRGRIATHGLTTYVCFSRRISRLSDSNHGDNYGYEELQVQPLYVGQCQPGLCMVCSGG